MKNYTTPNADMVLVSTVMSLPLLSLLMNLAGLGDNILDLDTIV